MPARSPSPTSAPPSRRSASFAKLVVDTRMGGKLSKKAGVTHFHVGPGKRRMKCLEEMLDCEQFEIDPCWLYPTHVERSEALMRDAIALTRRGCHVDVDVQEEDLARWIAFYVEHGGDLSKLTVSSDASKKGPQTLFEQIRNCARGHRLPLAQLLALVTRNTAAVLKLARKSSRARGAGSSRARGVASSRAPEGPNRPAP